MRLQQNSWIIKEVREGDDPTKTFQDDQDRRFYESVVTSIITGATGVDEKNIRVRAGRTEAEDGCVDVFLKVRNDEMKEKIFNCQTEVAEKTNVSLFVGYTAKIRKEVQEERNQQARERARNRKGV